MGDEPLIFKKAVFNKNQKEWIQYLENHNDVEFPADSGHATHSVGHQVYFEKISSLRAMLPSSLDPYNCKYQLRLTLFDTVNKKFIGRTFHSKFFAPDDDQQEIKLSLPVYFHSTVINHYLILVAEVVGKTYPKNPFPNSNVMEQLFSIGWGYYRLFKSSTNNPDVLDGVATQTYLILLLHGTPRALFYLDEPFESNTLLRNPPGCTISFTLLKHASLLPVTPLMQENVFYACHEKIPGLKHEAVRVKGLDDHDFYIQPKLLDFCRGYIENLQVNFVTSIENFEAELCKLISYKESPADVEGGEQVEHTRMIVSERRVEVGVHNGHCFVQAPVHAYLEPISSNLSATSVRSSSFGKGKRRLDLSGNCLYLRGRLHFDDLLPDPKMALVFKLHYLLSYPEQPKGIEKTETLAVMVAWTIWTPFSSTKSHSSTIKVNLYGGVSVNPSRQLFYNIDYSKKPGLDGISFNFSTSDHAVSLSDTSRVNSRVGGDDREEVARGKEQSLFYTTTDDENASPRMREVSFSPSSLQSSVVKSSRPKRFGTATDRSYNFSNVFDATGQPAFDVDTNMNLVNFASTAVTDNLHASEIIFQFQAYSDPSVDACPRHHQSLFFTFQFYRFESVTTERVSLGATELDKAGNVRPRIFRKIAAADSDLCDTAGAEVRFLIDLTCIRPGEMRQFLNYLATNSLEISVWNGESLMFVGSVSVPLRCLLRNGKPAVSAEYELDVTHTDYSCENTISAEMTSGLVNFLGVNTYHKGILYLKAAHVGHKGEQSLALEENVRAPLVDADLSRRTFNGGTISSIANQSDYLKSPRKVKPEKVRENSMKDCLNECTEDEKAVGQLSEKELRKKIRMQAVRESESRGDDNKINSTQRTLLEKQHGAPQIRELLTVMDYRNNMRDEHISEMLLMSITSTHHIYPTVGTGELVEFRLTNPFDRDETITVNCAHPDLRLIIDRGEWKYFKRLKNLSTPLEDTVFSHDSVTGNPEFLLQAKETVILPFRYQDFACADMSADSKASEFFNPAAKITALTQDEMPQPHEDKTIQVVLRTKADCRPISILRLKVKTQASIVNQTLRFFCAEKTFIKKCIRMPPLNKSDGAKFHVECDDPQVVCHTRTNRCSDPRELYIKAPCGHSPQVRSFYLTVYCDQYTAVPSQVWRFFIHAMQRVDVTCVYGQISKLPVLVSGGSTDRLVQCFSSDIDNLKVLPREPFVLSKNKTNEIEASVKTSFVQGRGTSQVYINVVDNEFHRLYKSCLIVVKTEEPIITKEFTLVLSKEDVEPCNKMVAYTNPYTICKHFHLSTSRSDILKFREDVLKLDCRQKANIGLRFQPGFSSLKKVPVYVFINDEKGINEESFLINLVWS